MPGGMGDSATWAAAQCATPIATAPSVTRRPRGKGRMSLMGTGATPTPRQCFLGAGGGGLPDPGAVARRLIMASSALSAPWPVDGVSGGFLFRLTCLRVISTSSASSAPAGGAVCAGIRSQDFPCGCNGRSTRGPLVLWLGFCALALEPLHEGQSARSPFAITALPGRTLDGKLGDIALAGTFTLLAFHVPHFRQLSDQNTSKSKARECVPV
jgi:hypothetical protein